MNKRQHYIINLEGIDYKKIINDYYAQKNVNNDLPNTLYDFKIDDKKINDDNIPKNNEIVKHVTMLDFKIDGILTVLTDKYCWWCRNQFNTPPIGLPICYYASSSNNHQERGQFIKNYFMKKNILFEDDDFFETEGIFCSLPCCKAYILDNPLNPRYIQSLTLLTLLCYKLYGVRTNIEKAPSWKLIDNYGGHLKINDFRDSFNKKHYNQTLNIKRPYMFSTGIYFEESKLN